LEDLDIDGRISLKMYGMAWFHLAEDRDKWQACERGNEPSCSIKCGEFLD